MAGLRLGHRGAKNPDGTMTLMQHLYELRRRLFIAVLGLFLGSVIGFIWYTVSIPAIGLRSLGDILTAPYCAVPSPPRVTFNGQLCGLLATGPFSILQIRFKAAIMAGAVLSCPIWLYQLWGFVTPALYSKERRFAVTFVSSAAVLFAGGVVLAYIVIPHGLRILLGFGGDTASAALDPALYFSFLLAMLLIFGVSFELPLLLIMLNFVGVLTGRKLAQVRRYAIFVIFVFAGLVVPGNEPFSMLALAGALVVLYEVAVQVAKLHDKHKAARLAADGLAGLDDDTASPLPTASTADLPGPVPASEAVPATEAPQRVPVPMDFGDAT